MFILYVDESGVEELSVPPPHFVLLGLMIPAADWKDLDNAIERVKARYGLPGVEIHAAWMARRFSEQEKIQNFNDLDRESRVDSFRGKKVGVRHYTGSRHCACRICVAHGRR